MIRDRPGKRNAYTCDDPWIILPCLAYQTRRTMFNSLNHTAAPRRMKHMRYMFNSRKQFQEGTVEQFVTDLKIRAQSFNFGDLQDSMIRDGLVLGITSQCIRERSL